MMLQARYTLELRAMVEDPNFNIFDFQYNFIDEDLKGIFEERFKEHFYFHEIGFETVARFKQRLKATLNRIAPYYTQLYYTELEAKKVNFLLNKDLKETFIRDIQRENNKNQINNNTSNNESNSKSNNINNSNDTSSSNSDNKNSNVENGVASLGLEQGYLTEVANEKINANSTSNSTNNNTSNESSNSKFQGELTEDEKEKEQEATTLISQGNIGITSSGQLLEDWRKVLINIIEMYLEECEPLFMAFF